MSNFADILPSRCLKKELIEDMHLILLAISTK